MRPTFSLFEPIWDEGFGLPPVEAMAAGLPVVTSRSGTVPETLMDGVTGFVVEKNNVEELAQALLLLLRDDNSSPRRDSLTLIYPDVSTLMQRRPSFKSHLLLCVFNEAVTFPGFTRSESMS
jgi:glycosyltransferase involved in cell wall biosynthesis